MSEQYQEDWATGKRVSSSAPEERVRQEYEKILVEEHGYTKGHLDINVRIQRGTIKDEKADIVIYETNEKNRRDQNRDIRGIIETKSPEREEGTRQLCTYMSASSSLWGVWTNGEDVAYFAKDPYTGQISEKLVSPIPNCGVKDLEQIGDLAWGDLKPPSNLKIRFKKILNTLYTNTNISRREKLGHEMVKILFSKIFDEKYKEHSIPEFRAGPNDEPEEVKNRISGLFKRVKHDLEQDEIFQKQESILLDAKSVMRVVGELQAYSLLEADMDVVGTAFEVFAESKFAGEKGEFFTPRQIIKIAVEIIDPSVDSTILDPACGSGGFLIYALSYLWKKMEKDPRYKNMDSRARESEKPKLASRKIYGIEKEIDLVRIAKAYMSIIGDGKSKIAAQNSLHAASSFQGKAREIYVTGGEFKKFDVILTNPPFGSKKEVMVLRAEAENFALGHKWKRHNNGEWERKNEAKKTPAQELFIERCIDMLADNGGKMAMVLPETYFHSPTKKYILHYIQAKGSINAVIDIPHNAFRPHCNAKTCMLVFEKGRRQKNDICFAVCEEIGNDHLGKPKYRFEKNGVMTRELWDDSVKVLDELSRGAKEHVFYKKQDEIKDNIFVPRYYWKPVDYADEAKKIGCRAVALGDLVESGEVEVFNGHGSPPGEYKGQGTAYYVRAGDIGNLRIYKNPVSAVPEFVRDRVIGRNGVRLQEGDVVFVKEGSYRIGDIAILSEFDTDILLNSHCLVFRHATDPAYFAYMMAHPLFREQIKSKTFISTTLPAIGDRWKEILLPMLRDEAKKRAARNKMKQWCDYLRSGEELRQKLY